MTWTREQDATVQAMARLMVDSKVIARSVGHSAASVRLRLATLRARRLREREREEHRHDE